MPLYIYHLKDTIAQHDTLRNGRRAQKQAKNFAQYAILTDHCAKCYHKATGKTGTQDTARRTEVDADRKQERL